MHCVWGKQFNMFLTKKASVFSQHTKHGLRSPAPPRDLHPVPHGGEGVQGRTHVQHGEHVVLVDLPAVIVVDHVPHFRAATVDDPVVPVEGQLVPGTTAFSVAC